MSFPMLLLWPLLIQVINSFLGSRAEWRGCGRTKGAANTTFFSFFFYCTPYFLFLTWFFFFWIISLLLSVLRFAIMPWFNLFLLVLHGTQLFVSKFSCSSGKFSWIIPLIFLPHCFLCSLSRTHYLHIRFMDWSSEFFISYQLLSIAFPTLWEVSTLSFSLTKFFCFYLYTFNFPEPVVHW